PFQWGSKRTGPDLARVGGKYSNEWQVAHLISPRDVVPGSVMPPYGFLVRKTVSTDDIAQHLKTNKAVGVPYTDDMIKSAKQDIAAQQDPASDGAADLAKRYPKAAVADFDGDPSRITEMDALVAYLQVLGRMVDFSKVKPQDLKQ
ncbi:MAG: cbb3-type cytochrome c oxidase subunit II, partial [Alphaproteobacteria bacterium]|nr:cbb3-type cytochrome c oxidase subunit II [Alphaproteobacteria bacterium]